LDAQFRRRLYLGSVFIRRSSPRPSVRPPSSRAGPLEGPCHPLGLVQTRSQTLAGPTVPAGVAADLPTAAAAISDTATAAAFAGSGDADTEAEAAWVANCDHHRVGGACCGWYRWRRLIERWHDSHWPCPHGGGGERSSEPTEESSPEPMGYKPKSRLGSQGQDHGQAVSVNATEQSGTRSCALAARCWR
jgi:hypothetical protein